jgi:hypothetical protein
MTKTVLITNLNEIKFVKVSCKHCGYAMQLPVKTWIEPNVQLCPVCKSRFPVEKVKKFALAIGSLQDNLVDDENLSDFKVEIETEEAKGNHEKL